MPKFNKFIQSFVHAANGISYTWKNEINFRIEACLGIIAILISLWFKVDLLPIILVSALVLTLEIVNTAIESLVDLVSPKQALAAKIAKDCAAGAVLLAAIIAVVIALLTILPAILLKFELI